jgi:phosphoribosylformimino-5-aminoimidazole carboxamide ribotide isomerase
MRIIPAIDILGGKCVRLSQGNYANSTLYNEDPLEVAKVFEDHGLRYLHLVDLDGARSGHIVHHKILEKIAAKTSLRIDFGGGLKSDDDLRVAFECGAHQITGGSIAVDNPEQFIAWLNTYGPERIILGADANQRQIMTHGWQQATSFDVVDFILDYQQKGVQYVVCTDVSKDGMLEGPSLALYEELKEKTAIRLIASGGISGMADLEKLQQVGCEAAIIGKAIYERRIDLKSLASLC